MLAMPKATGTRLAGRSVGGNTKLLPKDNAATLAELAGYKMGPSAQKAAARCATGWTPVDRAGDRLGI
jgi:hypothetical protein